MMMRSWYIIHEVNGHGTGGTVCSSVCYNL